MDLPFRRPTLVELAQVVLVLACWIGGVALRFQPQPYSILGGGLILAGCLLLAVFAKRRRP